MSRGKIPFFQERGNYYARLYEFQEAGKRAPIAKLCSGEEALQFPNGRKRTEQQKLVYLQERLRVVRQERLEAEEKRKEAKRSLRWRQLVQLYLDDHTSQAVGTQKMVATAAARLYEVVGDLEVEEIRAHHGYLFVKSLGAEQLSPATVRSYLRHIKAVLNWAVEMEFIDKVPKFKPPALPKLEPKVYSADGVQLMEDHLRNLIHNSAQLYKTDYQMHLRALMMMSQTGCRVGECMFLPLERINLAGGFIEVKQTPPYWKPKWLKEGILPVTDKLRGFLEEDLAVRDQDERFYLDSGNGTPRYRDHTTLNHAFKKYQRRLGIVGPKGNHGFRASVATQLLGQGVDSLVVKQLLRHSSLSVTEAYIATDHKLLKSAVEKMKPSENDNSGPQSE